MNVDRMDQKTVERLLDGLIVDPSAGTRPVVLLLTAVRAAPRPAELAGEGAAIRGYRDALADPAGAASPFRPTRRLAGFGIRSAVAAVAIAATGGVALAAATGTLPLPRPPHPPTVTPPPATVSPAGATAPGEHPEPGPGATGPGSRTPTPAAALLGLCRAYRADAGDNPERTLDNPVFSGLITAAGDRQRVGDYCDRMLAGEPTPADPRATERPEVTPSRPQPSLQPPPETPTGKPSAAGSDRAQRPTATPVPPADSRPESPVASPR